MQQLQLDLFLDRFAIMLIVAFMVQSIHEIQQEGMILQGLGEFWHGLIKSSFWEKPFWTCPICMCYWWGGLCLWYMHTIGVNIQWPYVPMYLIGASGISAYLNR